MTASDLEQLLEMGFEKERAELAVSKTGGLQAALEWLEENQDKTLEDIKATNTTTTNTNSNEDEEGPALKEGEEPRSLVCNECGKKFRSQAQAEFHASKTEHVDFSESTEELAPLTEEEKQNRLAELREKLAAKRAVQTEQDKADKKRNEEIRRKHTKESQDIKEELEKKERLKEAAQKRKEKQDEIDAKARIRAKIAADKEERRLKAEKEKAARAGQAPPPQPAAPSLPTTSGAVTSKPAAAYTETRLRLQTSKGNIMKTFPVETTLFEVVAALSKDDGLDVQSFTQNYPRKTFDSEYFGESLKDLGLIPSASLVTQ